MFKNISKLIILGAIIFSSSYFIPVLLAHLPAGHYYVSAFKLVISPPLTAGWWLLSLRLVRGHPAKVLDILMGFRCFLRVWITFMITTIIVLTGLVLLLIPGIIWLLKYGLSLFVVMDIELNPYQAIKRSAEITKGYKAKLFWLLLTGLVLFVLTWPFAFGLQNIGSSKGNLYMLVGIIPYLVGFLLVAPWLTAAWATAYDTLSKRYGQIDMLLEN